MPQDPSPTTLNPLSCKVIQDHKINLKKKRLSNRRYLISYSTVRYLDTSGLATTHVVVFLWVCKTSYPLLISPPPTNLPNSLPTPYHLPSILNMPPVKDPTLERNPLKIACYIKMWQHYTRYFPANCSTNPNVC